LNIIPASAAGASQLMPTKPAASDAAIMNVFIRFRICFLPYSLNNPNYIRDLTTMWDSVEQCGTIFSVVSK